MKNILLNLNIHEKYMKECLELAKQGEGRVSPNPLVGSIVLDKHGNVVGRGYHQKYGDAHAEINALNQAGERANGGTLYVNLEPCAHYGKTPPCIDRIIKEKIKTLIIGMTDPNPLVAGTGIKKAEASGILVIQDVLKTQCEKLNERFIKHITEKKPFIAVKTASTLDGKIATSTNSSKWITSELAREEVHRLRNKYDAILTGSGTILADNPSLTCRNNNGRNPVRIIIDSGLIITNDFKVYNNDGTKIILAITDKLEDSKFKKLPDCIETVICPKNKYGKVDLVFLTQKLYEMKIFSILIEAGGVLNGAFLKENLIDKFYFFYAPKILGDSNAKNSFEGFNIENINHGKALKFGEIKNFPPDIMIEGYLK